ncbi:hypothetical protein [Halovulum sp. GXIMD14793]
MKHLICALVLALPLAGPLTAQSGGFPVFGPSAEREAFFEAQRQERIKREDDLREARLEQMRLAAQERIAKAEAEAEAAKSRRMAAGYGCWPVPVYDAVIVGDGLTVAPVDLSACRTLHWWPRYYSTRTSLDLHFGEDGFSGSGSFVTPGLTVSVDVD